MNNNLPYWKRLLAERGILQAALDVHWDANGKYWCYPVLNLQGEQMNVIRKKSFDSSSDYKYLWEPKDAERPIYYTLPGLTEAIEKANGRLFWSSGEPDTLTYRAAKALNVLSVFGEKNTPDTLADDLKSLGVRSVEMYPDLDKEGYKCAARIKALLENSGIALFVYKLPGEFGSKYDINKLWQDVGFDYNKFWNTLDQCPRLELPEYTLPQLPPQREFDLENSGDLPQEVYDQIESRLGVRGYKANGYSYPVRCPLHDDTNPSAGWHRDKHILKCMVCHSDSEWALAKQVAEALGIAYRSNYPPSRAKSGHSTPPRTKSSAPRKTVYSYPEASDVAKARLFGDEEAKPALPIVWRNVAKFGGFARLIQSKKMVAIAGDSGDGKTAAMETQVDQWRRLGFSGWVWSPEWGIDELVYRTVQRMGGPSLEQIVLHLTWKALHKKGVHPDSNFGQQLKPEALALWDRLDAQIRKWLGRVYFIDKPGVNITNLHTAVREMVNECAVQGIVLHWGMADYAQLLDAQGNDNERTKRVIGGLKDCTIEMDLVTLVGSQVTKQAGAAALQGIKNGKHAMLNARSDAFNLQLMFSRHLDEKGEKTKFASVGVSKNNMGSEGVTALELDTRLMIWKDCVVENVNLNQQPINLPHPF